MRFRTNWYWVFPYALLACGGEVDVRPDGGDASLDAPTDHRVFRDPCFSNDYAHCYGSCLWTTPSQCDQIPNADRPKPILPDAATRLMTDGYCFPRKTCMSDSDCEGTQRCLNVLYGQCGYGGGCLSSPNFNCQYAALCIAPDDP